MAPKLFFMKTCIAAYLLLLNLLCSTIAFSQGPFCYSGGCSNLNKQYPLGTLSTTLSTWSSVATQYQGVAINAGNYAFYSVVQGSTYEWSTCNDFSGSQGWDAQLTLFDGSNNIICYNDNSGRGNCPNAPYLGWTATFTGTVKVLVSEYNCASQGTSPPYSKLVWRRSAVGGAQISLNGNLNFGNVQISTTSQTTLTITNTGTATLSVSKISCPNSFNCSWSGNISPSSSQNVTITFSPTSTIQYGGTITVTSNATSGTNTISCSGTGINSSGSGNVNVSITPQGAVNAGAQWNLDGGNWQNSGTTLNNVSSGNHTIYFNTISGWITPGNQSITVSNGNTNYITGTYTQGSQYGNVSVTINPSGAVSAGAQWNLDGGNWENSGTTLNNIQTGNHTIAFKSISNWVEPGNQSISVTNGNTSNVSGTYTQSGTPFIAVQSPNGGEVIDENSTYDIKWTFSNVSNVKIEYTTDGGSNWNTISSSVPANNKIFSWSTPSLTSDKTQCLVKISEISGSLIDQSNNFFTIKNITSNNPPYISYLETDLVAAQNEFDTIRIFGSDFTSSCIVEIQNGSDMVPTTVISVVHNILKFRAKFNQSPTTWNVAVKNSSSKSNTKLLHVANFKINLYNTEFEPLNFLKVFSKGSSLKGPETPVKICADGSFSSKFKIECDNSIFSLSNLRVEIDNNNDIKRMGYFEKNGQPTNSLGSYSILYKHPDYCTSKSFYDEFWIKFYSVNNSSFVLFKYPIRIYRTPVLFVHGFMGGLSTFEDVKSDFVNKEILPGELMRNYTYNIQIYNSAHGFYLTKPFVPINLAILRQQIWDNDFSSSKFCLIGHSMGGLLARFYQQSLTSINKKDIQKIITINTPHSGTQLANFLLKLNKENILEEITTFDDKIDHYERKKFLAIAFGYKGAIEDLRYDSDEIKDLNLSNNRKSNIAPSATIITESGNFSEQIPYIISMEEAFQLLRSKGYGFTSVKDLMTKLYREESDIIVPVSSQMGGINLGNKYRFDNIFHMGSTHKLQVKELLVELMNVDPQNPSFFSQSGFNPVTLNCDEIFKRERPASILDSIGYDLLKAFNEEGLTILSPSRNHLVLPGEKLDILCKGNPDVDRIFIDIYSGENNFYSNKMGNICSFNYSVPHNAYETIFIIARAYGEKGLIDYDTLSLDVRIDAVIDSIKFDDSVFYFPKNVPDVLRVWGFYSDGQKRDITHSPELIFKSSDNAIMTQKDISFYPIDTGKVILSASINNKTCMSKGIVFWDKELNQYLNVADEEYLSQKINIKVYPNPFSDDLTFEYFLPENSNVSLEIFSFEGNSIHKMKSESTAGKNIYSIKIPLCNSGFYYYRIRVNDISYSGKLLHLQ